MTSNAINISEFFPTESVGGEARPLQTTVVKEIHSAFSSGKKIVLLEAPVGSGKSAIAIALANIADALYESEDDASAAHILTPRKALQDQYYQDFKNESTIEGGLTTMKGRASYPCKYDKPDLETDRIINLVKKGHSFRFSDLFDNCSNAPCKSKSPLDLSQTTSSSATNTTKIAPYKSKVHGTSAGTDSESVESQIFKECTASKPCPYTVALQAAQDNNVIIHNVHSFVYQTKFSAKFGKRKLMIVDEAHDLASTLREFCNVQVGMAGDVNSKSVESPDSIDSWISFMREPKRIPPETVKDVANKLSDPLYLSRRDRYLILVSHFESNKDHWDKGFSVGYEYQGDYTKVTFIPHSLGTAFDRLIGQYGDKILLMSGTIFSKELFCKELGIPTDDVYFIRVPSTFPISNRPIVLKDKYSVPTSHAEWDNSLPTIIEKVKSILEIFHDAKGLIHAPSYSTANRLIEEMKEPRLIGHTSSTFSTVLELFFQSTGNQVLVSPICQQGVDFKQERGRFQIILRVPYLNTSDPYIGDIMKKDYPQYNFQALKVFGQQLGRVNRGPDDYGATFLLDSRFPQFISRNKHLIPAWVRQAVLT